MAQVNEFRERELIKATNGANIEGTFESQFRDENTVVGLRGRGTVKAEIAAGATLLTLSLAHAPKFAQKLRTLLEPSFGVEITTAALVKSLSIIPAGKVISFDGIEYPVLEKALNP